VAGVSPTASSPNIGKYRLLGDYQIGITKRGQRTRRCVAVRLDGPSNLPSHRQRRLAKYPPEKTRCGGSRERLRLDHRRRFAGIAAARGLKVEIVKTGSRSLSSRFSLRCGSVAHESVN
jgi:hypothetical protein